jgi:hypothetical protein
MALTLLEASKQNPGEIVRNAIIEMFARSTDVMGAMPFMDVTGGAYRYLQEGKLPGVGFRGVNEAFNESTGILNPQVEALRILGGDLDVDKAIVKFNGPAVRAEHEAMMVKSSGLKFSAKVITGDSVTDPREFDGLKNRINGSQLIDAGTTSGGDVLALSKLNELTDAVDSGTHLLMSKAVRRRITDASHAPTVSGYITYTQDQFGKRVTNYQELPILIVDTDDTGALVLPFTEPAPVGAQLVTTSIYCVSFGEGMLIGLQNGVMDVRDLGELQTAPVWRTRVDWYVGMAALHGRCAGRLRGIKDGVVIA